MTAPSIKEALEAFVKAYRSQESSTKGLDDAYAMARAALATLQPSSERREAIARIIAPGTFAKFDAELAKGRRAESGRCWAELCYSEALNAAREKAGRILASGLVQDEAGEPTTAMIDAGVAFALSVSLSGEYRWSQYVADLYKTMRAAAIRSARDGGAS